MLTTMKKRQLYEEFLGQIKILESLEVGNLTQAPLVTTLWPQFLSLKLFQNHSVFDIELVKMVFTVHSILYSILYNIDHIIYIL